VREKASLMCDLADLLPGKDDTSLLAAPAVVAGSAYSRS
jgi:hypothetical protein